MTHEEQIAFYFEPARLHFARVAWRFECEMIDRYNAAGVLPPIEKPTFAQFQAASESADSGHENATRPPCRMNDKQALFVAEYRKDLNATQAAIRAGYSAKTAAQQGERLLRNVEISAAVAKSTQQQLDKAELSAVRVLEELRRLSFADIRGLFDSAGNLKPLHELTAEQAACIAGFEVIKKNAEAGDGKTDVVHKIRVIDKTRSLEMLAKHFALLTEKLEHSGGLTIRHELPE